MSLRPLLVSATLLILIGVNAFLLYAEYNWQEEFHGIAPAEFQARHTTSKNDPLLDLRPLSSERERNLKEFGLKDEMIKAALSRMTDLTDRYEVRIRQMLDDAAEPTEIADAICGQTQQLRPRYGALRFLVEEKQGERRPVLIERISGFRRENWSRAARIDEVYTAAELGEERQADATLMGIAAILVKQEELLFEKKKPFGRTMTGTWSWSAVVRAHPGIEARMVEYFALFHVVWELASGEGGICGES